MTKPDELQPHSDEAERNLLACIFSAVNPASPSELKQAGLAPVWFYDHRCRKVFEAATAVEQEGARPDLATVGFRIKLDQEFKDGEEFLAQLPEDPGANAQWWFAILKEKFTDRTAANAGARIKAVVEDSDLSREAKIAELENVALTLRQFLSRSTAPPLQALADLPSKQRNDPDELLQYRFLCRGGGLLLAGPTGIGKSAFGLQAAILWALERPAFCIHPARPLRFLFVQAENDPGDMGEMRDGVIAGLELSEADAMKACQRIMLAREDERAGHRFFTEVVEPILSEQRPDLLWLDPALAYLGGEANSQRDVGGFLRNGLNPLLHRFGCAAVVIHHTNKPPSGKEKPDWSGSDFAYLGAGSAEWANWARAVLAIRAPGTQGVFELRAGKRGSRLGWKEADGSTAYARFIAHSTQPGVICWRELDARDVETGGRPKSYDPEELLALLPSGGLTTGEWQKLAKTECGISEATFHRERRAFLKASRILKSKVSNKWQPVKSA